MTTTATVSARRPVSAPLVLVAATSRSARRKLQVQIAAGGYAVLGAKSGQEALAMAQSSLPDLLLLDVVLPDMSGLEVTRRMRGWTRLPIILISSPKWEVDSTQALDVGADDFMVRPISNAELLGRLRMALQHGRKHRPTRSETVFQSGPLRVDLAAHRAWIAGSEVHLTPREFALLAKLVKHAGQVVPHRELLTAIWGFGSVGHVEYLRVCIRSLRQKLRLSASHPRLLFTTPGVGYRLQPEDAAGPAKEQHRNLESDPPPATPGWNGSNPSQPLYPTPFGSHEP